MPNSDPLSSVSPGRPSGVVAGEVERDLTVSCDAVIVGSGVGGVTPAEMERHFEKVERRISVAHQDPETIMGPMTRNAEWLVENSGRELRG